MATAIEGGIWSCFVEVCLWMFSWQWVTVMRLVCSQSDGDFDMLLKFFYHESKYTAIPIAKPQRILGLGILQAGGYEYYIARGIV